MKAFKDNLKYSDLLSFDWGFVIPVLFVIALVGAGCEWWWCLCTGFLCTVWALCDWGEHSLHRFLLLHFCNLCKKHLLDSYLDVCVALLNSVVPCSTSLQARFICHQRWAVFHLLWQNRYLSFFWNTALLYFYIYKESGTFFLMRESISN